jgi:nucleoside-diphosphate-sugar epimerase
MRVVVLGATGNVGTSVVQTLVDDDAVDSVVGVARRRPDWHPDKVEWVAADITTSDLSSVLDRADAVVHLAWAFQPTHEPTATWQVNVVGSARVLEAVARAGVPVLVYASSVGAYSPVSSSPTDEKHLVDESWPTHGWSPAAYCREKAYVERLLDRFELEHPECRVVRMRPCFLFKPEAAPEQRRIFAGPLVPERLAGRLRLPVVPNLRGLSFQAMHTSDAAEAYTLAVRADVRGAFNLAADPVVDAETLTASLGGTPMRVPVAPLRAALAAAWHARLAPAAPDLFDFVLRMPLMDTSRARSELGWSPVHSSVDAIDAFRAGLRSGRGFPTPPLQPSDGRLREFTAAG